jgi:glucose-1-phosphate cytidylyltransferase
MLKVMKDVTAVLLCGGKGERLKPFTDSLPKPLVPINGRPLLDHLIRYLNGYGITRFVICTGYKAEAIEAFVHEHKQPKWEIVCINSGDASMTDRILAARSFINGRALICYGDTLANIDLNALHRHHQTRSALATIAVYPLDSPFGIVNFDASGHVKEFTEKPRLPYWINIGFILCEPEALAHLQPNSDMPTFLSGLSQAEALLAYQHHGKHLTVNTEKDRSEAETGMVEFFTFIDGQTR